MTRPDAEATGTAGGFSDRSLNRVNTTLAEPFLYVSVVDFALVERTDLPLAAFLRL
ncbi:MAG: hypothetical protein ACYTGL_05800 [Planctomycetota bacterium]|jgi:hypothetical protein